MTYSYVRGESVALLPGTSRIIKPDMVVDFMHALLNHLGAPRWVIEMRVDKSEDFANDDVVASITAHGPYLAATLSVRENWAQQPDLMHTVIHETLHLLLGHSFDRMESAVVRESLPSKSISRILSAVHWENEYLTDTLTLLMLRDPTVVGMWKEKTGL